MKKICIKIFIAINLIFNIYSQPSLQGYLENDLQLKTLSLEVQKVILKNKQSDLENLLSVNLSTGKVLFNFNDENVNISFAPTAKISLPGVSNFSFDITTDINKKNNQTQIENTSLGFSIDLISDNNKLRKIEKIKRERELTVAKRKLYSRTIEAEKEYYQKLKNLYEYASDIMTSKNDLYEDTIEFEEVKAKGYAITSAKYRQAQLKILSDEHTVETKLHKAITECKVFASECGIEVDETFNENFEIEEFLPKSITQVQEVNILDYDKNLYTKIESVNYEHSILKMQREAKNNFSLNLNAGYTFRNTDTEDVAKVKISDTIDVGATANYRGLSLGTSVSFLTNGGSPIYGASFGINPIEFVNTKIQQEIDVHTEGQELIAIENAKKDYETDCVDKQNQLKDIIWSKESLLNTYNLYDKLAADLQKLYKEGIVREAEYLDAKANKELYKYRILINDIDLIIYNNSVELLFCKNDL